MKTVSVRARMVAVLAGDRADIAEEVTLAAGDHARRRVGPAMVQELDLDHAGDDQDDAVALVVAAEGVVAGQEDVGLAVEQELAQLQRGEAAQQRQPLLDQLQRLRNGRPGMPSRRSCRSCSSAGSTGLPAIVWITS